MKKILNFSFRFMASAIVSSFHVMQADPVQLSPSKDNSIYEEGPLSNGSGIHLFAGKTGESGASNYRRALIQFDVGSSIPAGSTIDSVTVTLHVSRFPVEDGTNLRLFGLHRMTADWGEGASDAPDAEGRGDAASSGDATWTHRFHPDQSWDVEGGDFNFFASATAEVSGIGSYDWSSSQLVEDVQGWLDNPQSNFGWILIGPNTDRTARRFDSRENPDTAVRPLLTVSYTPPVTSWGGFVSESNGRTVDTGSFLGIVDIAGRPWIYVYATESWIYLPEEQISEQGGWLYLPKR